jgi:hypothetical protein
MLAPTSNAAQRQRLRQKQKIAAFSGDLLSYQAALNIF